MKLIAACAFGLEALVKRELIALGVAAHVDQPGRVCFTGDWEMVCRANLWLRTADRVLIEVMQFPAADFEALFDTVKAFDWSEFLPSDAEFPVTGKSRLSTLTSVPAVQRSVKRAIVESLLRTHGTASLPESGAIHAIEVAILNDIATVTLDTTGKSLHKRGYRKLNAEAPLKETMASALIDLSVWHPDRLLVDPFCGSGTLPIEAAMIGMNIAPGLRRDFVCQQWPVVPSSIWHDTRQQAQDLVRTDRQLQIIGTDRDSRALDLANFHAMSAGVKNQVRFERRDFSQLTSDVEYGCIVTNPPYGERLEDEDAVRELYLTIPAVMERLPTWSLYLITSFPQFERLIQKEADRRRKLYNGRIECTYYQYLGPRPPRGHFPDHRQPSDGTSEPHK